MANGKRYLALSGALLLIAASRMAWAQTAVSETDPFTFVNEYISELSRQYELGQHATRDMQAPGANPLELSIYYGNRFEQLMADDIRSMSLMHVKDSPELPRQIAGIDELKGEMYSELVRISSAAIEGKATPDMLVRVPTIRAQLADSDDLFLQISAVVFYTLIDRRPDKEGHASHLVITRQQRTTLLQGLEDGFGPEIDDKRPGKDHAYLLTAAGVVEDGLHADYRCADDPW